MRTPPIDLVITDDVIHFLKLKSRDSLTPTIVEQLSKLKSDFFMEFSRHLPENITLKVRDVDVLVDRITAMAASLFGTAVSLDRVALSRSPFFLDITSIMTERGREWASKPQCPPIDAQLDELIKQCSAVKLVDIGSQSGSLISYVCGRLLKRNVKIGGIVIGIAGRYSQRQLSVLHYPLCIVERFEYLRWIELRDLLGLDGRIVMIEGAPTRLPAWISFIKNSPLTKCEANKLEFICKDYRKKIIDVLISCGSCRLSHFDDIYLGPA